jgi:predicted ABC-type ATPase
MRTDKKPTVPEMETGMKEIITEMMRKMMDMRKRNLTHQQEANESGVMMFEYMTRMIVLANTRGKSVMAFFGELVSLEIVAKEIAREVALGPEFVEETERIAKRFGINLDEVRKEMEKSK